MFDAKRMFVEYNDLDKKVGYIVAIDPRTAKVAWSAPQNGYAGQLFGIAAGGLVTESHGMLRVLDTGTGKQLASFGLPRRQELVVGSAPAIVACDGKELVGLDVGGTDETAKITGKLSCEDCDATKFPVRFGDATATTDDKGAFTITLVGAGRYELEVDLEIGGDAIGGTDKFVKLAGKGTYDLGKIEIKPPEIGD